VPMRGTKYGFIRSITLKDVNVNTSFSPDNLDTTYMEAANTGDIKTAQRLVEMLEKWEHEHKHYVENVAWIKQMLML